jgi:uncharacterized protein (DUF302 family)
MNLIRNILAIVGFLALLVVILFVGQIWNATRDFDPDAFGLYKEFGAKLLESGDIADAFVWAVPVEEGVSAEDVKESMKSLAVARNFLFVGESPFYKQAEAVTGKPYRHVSLMNFCDVRVGIKMIDQNEAYTAFMPCTISVAEDKEGKLWLYSLNMDFLIHGAKELPTDLKADALRVRRTMREIMEGAARGEF